ncbi:MAG: TonB-dependent receptor [Blastocatellia bacterium]
MFTRVIQSLAGRHSRLEQSINSRRVIKLANSGGAESPRCRQTLLAILVVAAIVALMSGKGIAAETGRVSGTILDPSGAKIAGARVALRDAAGLVVYQARTDSEGQFSIPDVVEGRYRVAVEAIGFTQAKPSAVDVRAGGSELVAVRMDVAAISDQLVITATRTEAPANELGGSVSVISSEDVTRGNKSIVSEALRSVPGIAVVQTGGRGGLTSIFTRGGESDYNKVLIDGVPVNRAGGGFDFAFLTPENIDRIEVARGPASAPLGSDAVTSAIQIITRRGSTATPEFEFSGEGGSFAFHRETARLSGLARWFDYSASVGFRSSDGRVPNSDYINRSASANFGFRFAPKVDLRITSRWNNSTGGVPGPTTILFSDPDSRQKHRDLALAATLNIRTTSRFHQLARFIYSEFDTNNFDPLAQDLTKPGTPPLPPFSFGADFVSSFKDHQKRSGIHYQGVAAINSANLLTAGIDFERESAVITSSNDFSRARVSPARNNLGFYIQDQLSWRERVFLTAGLRVENNTGTVPPDLRAVLRSLGSSSPSGDVGFGFSANPKIAVSLIARQHQENVTIGATRFKVSFGTAIKEPTLDEAFGPSIFALGNPGLDPERAVSFDAGVVQEFFARRLSVDLTYFDNRFRDLIIFDSTAASEPVRLANGTLTNFINADRASGRGVELSVSARPGGHLSRLSLTASYMFLRSRLDRAADVLTFPPPTFAGLFEPNPELGLPLLRRPRHSGAFEASWIEQRFDVTVDGSIVGRRRDFIPFPFAKFDESGKPIFNDGYAKVNAAGSYRVTSFLSLFTRVENLLNQNYEEVLGFPAYRLNFSAGLRIRVGGSN